MVRLFSLGLVANLIYVISGVVKQYLLAAQLSVASFGTYGTWVAQASLLVVVLPFPAYLEVMIKGFSALPEDHLTRNRLVIGVKRELVALCVFAGVFAVLVWGYSSIVRQSHEALVALTLLLVSQYLSASSDIMLRMFQAHPRIALFQAIRNVPSILLIVSFGLRSAPAVAVAELISAAVVGWVVYRAPVLREGRLTAREFPRVALYREKVTLWVARGVQYANSSLLRLTLPLSFSSHDTGLFFFACIAQIPCSLFLSVTTQLFGHSLARMKQGDYRAFGRIQLWFIVPNAVYAGCVALVTPYWDALLVHVPSLQKYAGIGPLILAVTFYSAVLSSDCQEYLLRSRGRSSVLLLYNTCSITTQIACVGVAAAAGMALVRTVMLCAVGAACVLVGFTLYSFRSVIGFTMAPKQPSECSP